MALSTPKDRELFFLVDGTTFVRAETRREEPRALVTFFLALFFAVFFFFTAATDFEAALGFFFLDRFVDAVAMFTHVPVSGAYRKVLLSTFRN